MKNLKIAIVVLIVLNILSFILLLFIPAFAALLVITWIANFFLCGLLASKMERHSFLWVLGAIFIPVIIPLVLVFLKESGETAKYQALRVKTSSSSDKQVVINRFTTDKAAVKAEIGIGYVVESLDNYLVKRFSDKGYQVVENGIDCPTINGSFIIIDEGSKFVRYVTGFAGNSFFDSAKIEVEGTIKQKDSLIKDFHFVNKGYAGFQIFGGSSQKILKNATKNMSKQILKTFLA
jgi:hypothetical protein